jgi:hypothetical protein
MTAVGIRRRKEAFLSRRPSRDALRKSSEQEEVDVGTFTARAPEAHPAIMLAA